MVRSRAVRCCAARSRGRYARRQVQYGHDDQVVWFPWEAVRFDASTLLPPLLAADPDDARWVDPHVTRTYSVPDPTPAAVRVRVRMRPVVLDMIDALIASGDLDPVHRDALPVYTLNPTVVEWSAEVGKSCVP